MLPDACISLASSGSRLKTNVPVLKTPSAVSKDTCHSPSQEFGENVAVAVGAAVLLGEGVVAARVGVAVLVALGGLVFVGVLLGAGFVCVAVSLLSIG